MSDGNEEDEVEKARGMCSMAQSMIDFTAKHLFGLRTNCLVTEEITQKQIRDTEGKLIKLFSRQLVAKENLATDEIPEALSEYPKTDQWLTIVGVNKEAARGIVSRGITLNHLLDMTDNEVRNLLLGFDAEQHEIKNLLCALRNLKVWTDRQLQQPGLNNQNDTDLELHWTTYNRSMSSTPICGNSPRLGQRPSTSSLPPDTFLNERSPQLPTPPQSTPSSPAPQPPGDKYRFTPPPTPPFVIQQPQQGWPKPGGVKYPSTPPPKKKMQLLPDAVFPLTKSKSHESQLANKVDIDLTKNLKKKPNNLKIGGSYEMLHQRRLSNEGSEAGRSGHSSPIMVSPLISPLSKLDGQLVEDFINKPNTLTVPRSPKAPPYGQRMMHSINHRFITRLALGTCDICHKQIYWGKFCKDCKFKCHRDCATKAAPACSVPREFVELFIEALQDGSPNTVRRKPGSNYTGFDLKPNMSVPVFNVPDTSSSTSSCNSSSTPSSPALLLMSSASVTSPSPAPSPLIQVTQFQFPDVADGQIFETSPEPDFSYQIETDGSCSEIDFINTTTSNISNDSDKTLVDSNTSERIYPDRVDSIDSQDDPLGHNWNRQNSLSIALREWDIPFEDLEMKDIIGIGRFGAVYKGTWHGDVAIKMFKMGQESETEAQLNNFKLEIAMLRKTRHDNLVLFMGACMKPPHLAIVTSLCKGKTLYTQLHVLKDKFILNKCMIVASQIAQGMSYLHSRGIIHKDLKTKNIFLEKERVVITDFGLFNVTRLCHEDRKGEWLTIPPGWLCYLAPEVIRLLQAGTQHANCDLPFSEQSDIYAFGTVWYELIMSDWPFQNKTAEMIIWQVGKGIKPTLSNIQGPREIKDILMACWAYRATNRIDFIGLLKLLERLPKKRLLRSPSHPIQLSRSVENLL